MLPDEFVMACLNTVGDGDFESIKNFMSGNSLISFEDADALFEMVYGDDFALLIRQLEAL
jgi:hypothetical protein